MNDSTFQQNLSHTFIVKVIVCVFFSILKYTFINNYIYKEEGNLKLLDVIINESKKIREKNKQSGKHWYRYSSLFLWLYDARKCILQCKINTFSF